LLDFHPTQATPPVTAHIHVARLVKLNPLSPQQAALDLRIQSRASDGDPTGVVDHAMPGDESVRSLHERVESPTDGAGCARVAQQGSNLSIAGNFSEWYLLDEKVDLLEEMRTRHGYVSIQPQEARRSSNSLRAATVSPNTSPNAAPARMSMSTRALPVTERARSTATELFCRSAL
jgi:hypothetical protein